MAIMWTGTCSSLGQRQAVAQLGNLRMSGLPAWLAWHGIYLAKLPTLANKVRVRVDWLTDLFAPLTR
jgi:NADH dehydrogenase